MRNIKEEETKILAEICRNNDLPVKIVQLLLKSAKQFSYENISASARKKEYLEIINYYSNQHT